MRLRTSHKAEEAFGKGRELDKVAWGTFQDVEEGALDRDNSSQDGGMVSMDNSFMASEASRAFITFTEASRCVSVKTFEVDINFEIEFN